MSDGNDLIRNYLLAGAAGLAAVLGLIAWAVWSWLF